MRFSSFTYLVRQGLHSMRANRLMTFASMGVLTVCMVLIGLAYLLGVNVDAIVEYIGEQNESIVYLEDGLSEEQIADIDAQIRATPGVVSVTYVSPEDVLATYSGMLDEYANMYEAFENDNPFSANYRVVIQDISQLEQISDQLGQIEGVATVSAPLELSHAFTSIQKVVSYGSYGLVAVLAIVSIVVINNTIRITVFARRKEIGIMKLVGATNGFIRWPFVYEGFMLGLLGAVIAFFLQWALYAAVARGVDSNDTLQLIRVIPFSELWAPVAAVFVLAGIIIGVGGSLSAIRKFLQV